MPRTSAPLTADATPAGRRIGGALLLGAGALAAWTCWLASTLPPSGLRQAWSTTWTGLGTWQLTWVGVDALEVLGLVVTGTALRRGHWLATVGALVSVPLFVLDGWFDVMTSASRPELWQATAMAVLVELPTAAVLAWVAWRGLRALRPPTEGGSPPRSGSPADDHTAVRT